MLAKQPRPEGDLSIERSYVTSDLGRKADITDGLRSPRQMTPIAQYTPSSELPVSRRFCTIPEGVWYIANYRINEDKHTSLQYYATIWDATTWDATTWDATTWGETTWGETTWGGIFR